MTYYEIKDQVLSTLKMNKSKYCVVQLKKNLRMHIRQNCTFFGFLERTAVHSMKNFGWAYSQVILDQLVAPLQLDYVEKVALQQLAKVAEESILVVPKYFYFEGESCLLGLRNLTKYDMIIVCIRNSRVKACNRSFGQKKVIIKLTLRLLFASSDIQGSKISQLFSSFISHVSHLIYISLFNIRTEVPKKCV